MTAEQYPESSMATIEDAKEILAACPANDGLRKSICANMRGEILYLRSELEEYEKMLGLYREFLAIIDGE